MRLIQVGLDKTTRAFLRECGFLIEDTGAIEDVEELESWLKAGTYDAAILNLASGSFGIYAPRHFRNQKMDVSIVGILPPSPEKSWSEDRAVFLDNGGDDLLQGPANPRELAASLRAVTRRFKGANVSVLEFHRGGAVLKINQVTRSVTINGREPMITNTEREMLLHFAAHPGRIISKESVMDNLYSLRAGEQPEIKIVDVFVCKVRKKMELMHPDAEHFIETVWGAGYRLADEKIQSAA